MKTATILTLVAIVAVLGIFATATIGTGLQQASASSCNFHFDNNQQVSRTGSSCDQRSGAPGTFNDHVHFHK